MHCIKTSIDEPYAKLFQNSDLFQRNTWDSCKKGKFAHLLYLRPYPGKKKTQINKGFSLKLLFLSKKCLTNTIVLKLAHDVRCANKYTCSIIVWAWYEKMGFI